MIGTLGFDLYGVHDSCCVRGKCEGFTCVKAVSRSRSFVTLTLNYGHALIASCVLLCLVIVGGIEVGRIVSNLVRTNSIVLVRTSVIFNTHRDSCWLGQYFNYSD